MIVIIKNFLRNPIMFLHGLAILAGCQLYGLFTKGPRKFFREGPIN